MNGNTENKVYSVNNTVDGDLMENKATEGSSADNAIYVGKTDNKIYTCNGCNTEKIDKMNTASDNQVILERNIGELLKNGEITTDEYTALWRENIITVRDITEKSQAELLAIFNSGTKSRDVIVDMLKKYGLTLKGEENSSSGQACCQKTSEISEQNREKSCDKEKSSVVAAENAVDKKAPVSSENSDGNILLKKSIDELNFTVRTYNRLVRAEIKTVADIVEKGVYGLICRGICDDGILFEITDTLENYGIELDKEKESYSVGNCGHNNPCSNEKEIPEVIESNASLKSCGNGGITDFSENDEEHSDGIENEVFLDNGEKSCCSGISDFFDDENSDKKEDDACTDGDEILGKNLNRLIDDGEISRHEYTCFRHRRIETIGDIIKRSEAELLEIPDFGKGNLERITAMLAKYGLSLRKETDEDFSKGYYGRNMNGKEEALSKTIDSLFEEEKISLRERDCLKRAGVITVRDLTEKSEVELYRILNSVRKKLGRTAVDDIIDLLRVQGLNPREISIEDFNLSEKCINTVEDCLNYGAEELDRLVDEEYSRDFFRYLREKLDGMNSNVRWEKKYLMDSNSYSGGGFLKSSLLNDYDKERGKYLRLRQLDGFVVSVEEEIDFAELISSSCDEPCGFSDDCAGACDGNEKTGENSAKKEGKRLEIKLQNVTGDFMRVKLVDLYLVDMVGRRCELEKNCLPWFDVEYIPPKEERRIHVIAGKELDYKFYWHIMAVFNTSERNADGKIITKERVYKIEHDEDEGGFYLDDYFEMQV